VLIASALSAAVPLVLPARDPRIQARALSACACHKLQAHRSWLSPTQVSPNIKLSLALHHSPSIVLRLQQRPETSRAFIIQHRCGCQSNRGLIKYCTFSISSALLLAGSCCSGKSGLRSREWPTIGHRPLRFLKSR
jgi:hypothetical protein